MKLCPELAEYLKNAEKTAHRFAPEGRVPGFEVGSTWGKRKSEMDHWMSKQEGEDKTDGN